MRSALLMIDTQRDFLNGGASPVPGTSVLLPAMGRLVEGYRFAGLPIVHAIRLYAGDDVDLPRRTALRDGARIVRPGSSGADIASALLPSPGVSLESDRLLKGAFQRVGDNEVVMWKPRWSAFYRTSLDEHLGKLGVNTTVLAGCNFPNCPRATLFDASERDYRVAVVDDATSLATPDRLADAALLGVHSVPTRAVLRRVAPEFVGTS